MPTYQYACTACGDQLEVRQSFSDPALTECPRCQGRLRKVFSAVGVVFKGSGFYRTDSRTRAKEGSDGAGSGAADAASESPAPGDTAGRAGDTRDKPGGTKQRDQADDKSAGQQSPKPAEATANARPPA
ncbi:MAG: FmdB family transcriptional regulator [Actinomycetota bacterium]|nr:FmdB family transcriptional regulator [Actinomycetota bacterium]